MREKLDVGDEFHASVVSTLQPESEDRSRALRRIFFCELVILVAGQPRIAEPGDLRSPRQPFCYGERSVAMPLPARSHSLDAGDPQEGVERRQRRTEIAQSEHATGDRK